jgi:hypothetical protein
MTAEQRTMTGDDGKTYRRYKQKAFLRGKEQGPTVYVDWFTDDETAARESKEQLEYQGYAVSRVEVVGDEVQLHLGK